MFRVFQRYVSFVFSGRMLQVCLSGCCICFTHTLHALYLDVCVWLQCFLSVFQVFQKLVFKCFNCLQTYVATVVFGCFKSRSGVASLLLGFCCIVSVCPLPGAGRRTHRDNASEGGEERCNTRSTFETSKYNSCNIRLKAVETL